MNTDSQRQSGASPARLPHPRGLYTLFLTEMWERFSYYGMRAFLVLFMVAAIDKGGLGMSDKIATSIYGLYTAAVYLLALPGGWVSDRLLGARRSVWYGGIIIATGHFILAGPRVETFFLGLVVVAVGTGLLKPNISARVGEIYPEGGARRDAGFTIFYMGINIGAALGPLICSYLGEKFNWHYGFAAAGVGMVLGLVQFHISRDRLGNAPFTAKPLGKWESLAGKLAVATLAAIIVLAMTGVIRINPVVIAQNTAKFIVAVASAYFTYIFFFAKLDRVERGRVGVIIILFVAAALFWAGFEQVGSSFNLFADRYTARRIAWLDYVIPAGWFQSLGPVFVIAFAPVAAAIWVAMARKNINPSLGVKFGIGLILLAAGFLVMAGASRGIGGGQKVWPTWLVATYLLHTFGELCLSPVGLSSVTKLAPKRLVGQMMGVWFLGASLGNLVAGLLAGTLKSDAVQAMPGQYLQMMIMPMAAGIVLMLLARPIKKWAAGVE